MKLIEEVCDFPSPLSIELKDEEALDSLHAHLVMVVIKDIIDEEETRVIKQMEKTEAMCKFLEIEGY